jgi:hypothetical protein
MDRTYGGLSLWLSAVVLAMAHPIGAGWGEGSSMDTVPAQEISAAPERHYGEDVAIEAEMSRRIDHRVWEMANGRLFVIFDQRQSRPRQGLKASGRDLHNHRKAMGASSVELKEGIVGSQRRNAPRKALSFAPSRTSVGRSRSFFAFPPPSTT